MSSGRAPWWVRLLLARFPERFRSRHGPEIEEFVAAELEGAGWARWPRAVAVAWDLARGAHRLRTAEPTATMRGRFDGEGWMVGAMNDLRIAARGLLRSRGFSTVVVCTLALAVGLNTALFVVIDSVLLEPLPYEHPDELVYVEGQLEQNGFGAVMLSAWHARQVREGVPALARLEAIARVRQNLNGAGLPRQVQIGWVSGGFLEMLGAEPELGRIFRPDDPSGLVLLSHRLWEEAFGGDPNALGRSVSLDGHPYTIVGVMPAGFEPELPAARAAQEPIEIWKNPDALWQNGNVWDEQTARSSGILRLIGRLAPGATAEEANLQAAAVTARTRAQLTDAEREIELRVHGLRERLVSQARPTLLVLAVAVAMVLIIACANVANLVLVRAHGRRRELAVRVALGSPRSHLGRFLLGETLLLALVSAAVGVGLAAAFTAAAPAFAPPELPRARAIGLDGGALAVAALCALLAAALSGLAPAVRALRTDPASELGAARSGGVRSGRGRDGLVVAQVALSLVLLVGTGLLVSSLVRLQRVPLGFDPSGIVAFGVSVPGTRYGWPEDANRLYRAVEERIAQLPGVSSAGVVWPMPFGGTWSGDVVPSDGTAPSLGVIPYYLATEGYFPTVGIPLRDGRLFAEGDDRHAVLVSETVARRAAPDGSVLGRKIRANPWGRGMTDFEVIGVVGDVRGRDLREEPVGGVYFDARSWSWVDWEVHVLARTDRPLAAFVEGARDVVASLDAEVPVAHPELLGDRIARQTAATRFVLGLLGIFTVCAGLVALVGLYGVMSYSVGQRRREIGIRMALGSARADIVGRVLAKGFALALAGVALGSAASLFLGRFLESLLYGVEPGDPVTLVATASFMVLAGTLASWMPAWRAARTDPMEVLRTE